MKAFPNEKIILHVECFFMFARLQFSLQKRNEEAEALLGSDSKDITFILKIRKKGKDIFLMTKNLTVL